MEKSPKYNHNRRGFTLVELLITTIVLAVLVAGVLTLVNPLAQINRSRDLVRKKQLDTVRKGLEDYFTDKGCYPRPTDICYDAPDLNNACHVCTKVGDGRVAKLAEHIGNDICDPEQPLHKYYYHAGGNNQSCPQWYAMFTNLTAPYDQSEDAAGCGPGGGCGINPIYGYDYMVEAGVQHTEQRYMGNWFCYVLLEGSQRCLTCGSYSDCLANADCKKSNQYFPTVASCIKKNPGAH